MAIPTFTALTPEVLIDYRNRLVASKGDHEAAKLSLQDIRNMIYTRMLHLNPNIEAEEAEKATKEAKPKGPKKVTTIKGAALDSTLSGDVLG